MEYESRLGFWKVDQKVKKREKLMGVGAAFTCLWGCRGGYMEGCRV